MTSTGSTSPPPGAASAPQPAALPTAVLCLHGPLRKLAGGAQHELAGATVVELLRALERRHPETAGWILDERGRIRRHINVFVRGERATEASTISAGDPVEVLPAITGG